MSLEWWHVTLASLLGLAALAAAKPKTLGERILRVAHKYAGTKESGGHNRGPLPDRWNSENKSPLGSNYCANALASIVREALGTLVPPWLTLSAAAKNWRDDAVKAGRWLTAAQARADPSRVRRGMFAVWDRSQDNKPETSWWGHIGLVDAPVQGTTWQSFEANSGPIGVDTLVWSRQLSDPKLLGFGSFDAPP